MRRDIACAATTLLTCLLLASCSSEIQRQNAEHRVVKDDVIREVERICALPDPQRTDELESLTAESGYALVCAKK